MTRDLALLLLRSAGLGLALAHGWGKIEALTAGELRFVRGVSGLGFPVPVLFAWAAAVSEFLGGLFVALGLWTRIASCFAAVTMAVAAFVRHHAHEHLLVQLGLRRVSEDAVQAWGDPEKALLYLLVFAALAVTGPGRLSLDSLLGRGRG